LSGSPRSPARKSSSTASIDFLDLVFQLEDALGFGVPYQRWQRYVAANYTGRDLAVVLTPEVIEAFAVEVMAEQAAA
jgi:hypothetical protein